MNKTLLIKYVVPAIIALLSVVYFFSTDKTPEPSASEQIQQKKSPIKPESESSKLDSPTSEDLDFNDELNEMDTEENHELPEDLRRQLEAPPQELPEDMKKQLTAPEPEMPAELREQLEGGPPPSIPEDVKRSLMDPTGGSKLADTIPVP
jgi:hypothetical protein